MPRDTARASQLHLLMDEGAQDRIVTRIAIQQLPTGNDGVRAFLCKRHRNFAKRDGWQIGRAWRGRKFMHGGATGGATGSRPLIAVVQRAKDELWVLPRGKLKSNESALAGARREVVEETGHRVRVREFLGAITYRARGRPKVVQFWRMQAEVKASRDVMEDIV